MCAQSLALGTRTNFQIEILTINVISGVVYYRENILGSSRYVSETAPWTNDTPVHRRIYGVLGGDELSLVEWCGIITNTTPGWFTETGAIVVQVQFIDAWHQIWKLCEIYFEWKNPFMCGFICLQFMYLYVYTYLCTEEALSSSNCFHHDKGTMDSKTWFV